MKGQKGDLWSTVALCPEQNFAPYLSGLSSANLLINTQVGIIVFELCVLNCRVNPTYLREYAGKMANSRRSKSRPPVEPEKHGINNSIKRQRLHMTEQS